MRELRNVIESVVVFHQGDEIQPPTCRSRCASSTAAVGGRLAGAGGGRVEPRTMADIERQAILETLARTGGHRARAADVLGIGLRTLQRKLKEYKDEGHFQDDH